jgi:hypothetical protein
MLMECVEAIECEVLDTLFWTVPGRYGVWEIKELGVCEVVREF